MKRLFSLAILSLAVVNLRAQERLIPIQEKFDFSVSAGTTVTFLPDFQHDIIVADGWVAPEYYAPENGQQRFLVDTPAKTEAKLGWYVQVESTYKLFRQWNISVSAGIKKIRFDYETNYRGGIYYADPIHIDALEDNFGYTRLTYLTITPCISRNFLEEQFRIQLGPVFNLLLKDNVNNTLILDGNGAAAVGLQNPEGGIFDTVGKVRKLTYGINLRLAYTIFHPISVTMGAQYFFNSLYRSESHLDKSLTVEKLSPVVIDLGVNIKPFRI